MKIKKSKNFKIEVYYLIEFVAFFKFVGRFGFFQHAKLVNPGALLEIIGSLSSISPADVEHSKIMKISCQKL